MKKKLLTGAVLTGLLAVSLALPVMAMPSDIEQAREYDLTHPDDDEDSYDGDLETPDDVYWDGNIARWDSDGDADRYHIVLYRNGERVDSATSRTNHHSFSGTMSSTGTYRFKVRAEYDDGTHGDWSDLSDAHHKSGYSVVQHADSHANGTCSNGPASGQVGWIHEANGNWWYRNSDGSYPSNAWQYVDGHWYYFDGNGYMKTGWINANGYTYYSLPNGQMATGWQNIGGTYYYFDLGMGGLWRSNTTPDGHVVDANGAMVR